MSPLPKGSMLAMLPSVANALIVFNIFSLPVIAVSLRFFCSVLLISQLDFVTLFFLFEHSNKCVKIYINSANVVKKHELCKPYMPLCAKNIYKWKDFR